MYEVKAMKHSGQALMPRCRMDRYAHYCGERVQSLLYIFWVYRAELGECEYKHEVFEALDDAEFLQYQVDGFTFHKRVKDINPERWRAYGKRYNGDSEFYRVTPKWLRESFLDQELKEAMLNG